MVLSDNKLEHNLTLHFILFFTDIDELSVPLFQHSNSAHPWSLTHQWHLGIYHLVACKFKLCFMQTTKLRRAATCGEIFCDKNLVLMFILLIFQFT